RRPVPDGAAPRVRAQRYDRQVMAASHFGTGPPREKHLRRACHHPTRRVNKQREKAPDSPARVHILLCPANGAAPSHPPFNPPTYIETECLYLPDTVSMIRGSNTTPAASASSPTSRERRPTTSSRRG